MVEMRRRTYWEPISLFMTLFANANKDPKKKAFKIDDFFPFAIKKSKKDYESLPKAHISDLKYIFKGVEVKNAPV